MQQPQYIATPAGVQWLDTEGRLHLPLREALALLYDTVEGVLLKHGDRDLVEEQHRKYSGALAGTTLAGDLEVVEIEVAKLTLELLAEVNRAIQISGYIARLVHILKAAPEAGAS